MEPAESASFQGQPAARRYHPAKNGSGKASGRAEGRVSVVAWSPASSGRLYPHRLQFAVLSNRACLALKVRRRYFTRHSAPDADHASLSRFKDRSCFARSSLLANCLLPMTPKPVLARLAEVRRGLRPVESTTPQPPPLKRRGAQALPLSYSAQICQGRCAMPMTFSCPAPFFSAHADKADRFRSISGGFPAVSACWEMWTQCPLCPLEGKAAPC